MTSTWLDLLARSSRMSLMVDLILRATVVLVASGAIALLLRRSSAAARHLAWCLGLGGVLVLPGLSLALPGWSWRVLPKDKAAARMGSDRPTGDAPAGRDGGSGSFDAMAPDDPFLAIGPAGPSARPAAGPVPASPMAAVRGMLVPSWSWLSVAWVVGCVTVLAGPIAGRITLRGWARRAEPITGGDWMALRDELTALLGLRRRVVLLRDRFATMPMTWGWLRPVVLLPAEADEWSSARRRDVLLHELAHVRRLDGLTQAMATMACALYWFHPLAWLASRRMRVERERACDDVVLLAGSRASDYAGHLLEIARGLRASRAAGMAALAMARSSQLEGRLLAILDPDRRRRGPSRRAVLAALVGAVLILLPLAIVRVGARAGEAAKSVLVDERPSGARMTVTGRVLDPAGRPVPDAAVMVMVPEKYPTDRAAFEPPNRRFSPMTAYDGRCDGSGRFRIELPRTSSARDFDLTVVARAPGFGLGWADLDADADPPVVDVSLLPEQVVRGRLLDTKGQPVPNVVLRVRAVGRWRRGGTSAPTIRRPDASEPAWHEHLAWSGPTTSDERGDFTLRGLGRGVEAGLLVDDPRFSLPGMMGSIQTQPVDGDGQADTDPRAIQIEPGPDAKPIKIVLQPPRTIRGRVTYADTGRPVPHALIANFMSFRRADAEGRFRIDHDFPPVARYPLMVQAPVAAPYMMARRIVEWPAGAVEQSVDIALNRGVVVHGRVTEAGTGRPVAGAIVRLAVMSASRNIGDDGTAMPTGPDGTYRVAGPPGPAWVIVQGPSDDYVLRANGAAGWPVVLRPGRSRVYAHAFRILELKAGADQVVNLAVRRGSSVAVRVVDPDGKPARGARVFSRLLVGSIQIGGWKKWISPTVGGWAYVRDGRVVLRGLDPNPELGPDAEVSALFLDAERDLGAEVRLSARSPAGEVVARLQPCGTALARLVDAEGKPLAAFPAKNLISVVVTPGPSGWDRSANDGPLFADESNVGMFDWVHYGPGPQFRSDGQGRIRFPGLIPGAVYRAVDHSTVQVEGKAALLREFTVEAGQTLDLGDLRIARPRAGN